MSQICVQARKTLPDCLSAGQRLAAARWVLARPAGLDTACRVLPPDRQRKVAFRPGTTKQPAPTGATALHALGRGPELTF